MSGARAATTLRGVRWLVVVSALLLSLLFASVAEAARRPSNPIRGLRPRITTEMQEVGVSPSLIPHQHPAHEPATNVAVRCPILYYHEVPNAAQFDRQLSAFLQAGYRPIALGALVDSLEGRRARPEGCLVLTFDDGLSSQMNGALPVLVKHQLQGTFFPMPSFHDGVHRYMGPDDFRTLRNAGMEIGSHTLNHASIAPLLARSFGAFMSEITQSKADLQTILGQPIHLFAYPNGSWNRASADLVRQVGYRAAVSTMKGQDHRLEDRYWLRRVVANPGEAPATVLSRLAS